MGTTIDATGKACPIPFMLAKECIDKGETQFSILVDNKAAVENLKRLANYRKFSTKTTEQEANFSVTFSITSPTSDESYAEPQKPTPTSGVRNSQVLFIGKDYMGEGTFELGRNLLRMFLYTIEKEDNPPKAIVLMNNGVKIAVEDEQCITTLQSLIAKGVSLTVCGTCLDYYRLLDDLKVRTVGNMYDITQILLNAEKVITV